jgi:hypothetical protein
VRYALTENPVSDHRPRKWISPLFADVEDESWQKHE